jgi:hypothetical protein
MAEQSASELVARLLAADDDPERMGEVADDLLRAIHSESGVGVDVVVPLLRSDRNVTVEAGVWIASELGVRAEPLLAEVEALLGHPDRNVRFFAITTIHDAAVSGHGRALARAAMLIADPDSAVRWKALHFLAWASRDQLLASVDHVTDPRVRTQVAWLAALGDRAESLESVAAKLDDADGLVRLFAVAAATRLSEYTRGPLERASRSPDTQVSSFAKEELESPPRRRRGRGSDR